MWCGDGTLVVTSVAEGALYRVWPEQNRATRIAETGGGANGAALAADGSILVTQNGGYDFQLPWGCSTIRRRSEPVTPGLATRAARWRGQLSGRRGFLCPNDLAVAADGTVYFTDPATTRRPKHRPGASWRYGARRVGVDVRRRTSPTATASRSSPTAPWWWSKGAGCNACTPTGAGSGSSRRSGPVVATASASTPTVASTWRPRSSTASASSIPTARSSTSSRSTARDSPPTAASAATTCARCSSPTRSRATSSRSRAADAGSPAPDVAGAVVARQRISARTDAARSRAQRSGSSSGQPLLGQIEVLDREQSLVVELFEPAQHRLEVDLAGRVVDVHLRVPAPPWRSCT